MATILKSTQKATNDAYTATTLSSWSRPRKLAMMGSFAILVLLLAISAYLKQSAKPAQAIVSRPAPASGVMSAVGAPQTPAPKTAETAGPAAQTVSALTAQARPAKKASKKRPANVTYSDADSGLSFVYPRKFTLTTGGNAQPQFDNDVVPMNFVQAGGATVATVALPKNLYPGTDLTSAFFSVNVNRSLSEEQCSHFAFVDTRDADGEPIDAEKVKVGETDMLMTSEFAGSATKQAEAQYYHDYENGACYEYVLGFGTAGYGVTEGIEPANRDEVFARLEKILATVKVRPFAQQQVGKVVAAGDAGK